MRYETWQSHVDYAAIMSAVFNVGGDYKDELSLIEQDIYGSRRLGMIQMSRLIVRVDYAGTINTDNGYGNVQAYGYETPCQGIGKVGTLIAEEEKAIVIGEKMSRVKTAAKSIGAKYSAAWKKYFPVGRQMTSEELEAAIARNNRWINGKIDAGYQIYTIGPINEDGMIVSPFFQT